MPSVIKSIQFDGTVQPYVEDEISKPAAAKPEAELLLEDAQLQARQTIDSARAYGDELVRTATEKMNRESEALLKQTREEGLKMGMVEGERVGRDAGHQAGYKEGFSAATIDVFDQNKQFVDQLVTLMETLSATREKVAEKCRDELGEFAFEIARTVIEREIRLPESALLTMIDGALDRFGEQEWLRIYLSETMVSQLDKEGYNFTERLMPISKTVKVIPTKGFDDDDCIIEHPQGAVELSVGPQMEKIRSVIKW